MNDIIKTITNLDYKIPSEKAIINRIKGIAFQKMTNLAFKNIEKQKKIKNYM
jgi:hypothetical protein